MRRTDVDALRVVAAIMVITIHATGRAAAVVPAGHGVAYWLALVGNEFSRCSVPVFLAISGWTLLSRPVRLQARLVRLLVPLAVWSIVFYLEAMAQGIHRSDWIVIALAGPGVRDHLWYFYFLVPIIVVVWLLRQPQTTVAYGVIGGLVVAVRGLASAFRASPFWIGYAWAIGYVGVGYAILEHRPVNRLLAAVLYVAACLSIVASARLLGYGAWPTDYWSPLVVVAAAGLMWLFHSSPLNLPGASLTLGVYLVHPLVLDFFRAVADSWSPVPKLLLIWLPTIPISFALVWLWHRSSRLAAVLG